MVPGDWPRCLDAGLLLKNWSCPDTFKFEVRKHFPDQKTAPQVKYPPKASADDVQRGGGREGESVSTIGSDQMCQQKRNLRWKLTGAWGWE